MTAIVELMTEIKKVILYLESKQFYIPAENVRLLTDSECSLIWARVLQTRFKIGVQTLITKLTLILYDLNLCPFKNLNFIDQTTYQFPVDALTKLNPKESFKTIQERHKRIRECDWLNCKDTLLEVINKPWIPKHEAQTYMQEAEPLADFKYLLESGINQLKTDIKPSQSTNIITFYNELNNLYDPIEPNLNKNPNDENSDLIPVFTIQNENIQTLSDQILEIYDNQRKLGRNIIAKHGIYYIFG